MRAAARLRTEKRYAAFKVAEDVFPVRGRFELVGT
jgi:hypothetical protein